MYSKWANNIFLINITQRWIFMFVIVLCFYRKMLCIIVYLNNYWYWVILSDNLSLIGNGSWVNYCRKLSSYRRIKHRPCQAGPKFHYSYNRFLYSRQPGQHPVHPNDCHRSGHPCGDVVQSSRSHFSKKVPADHGKDRICIKNKTETCGHKWSGKTAHGDLKKTHLT